MNKSSFVDPLIGTVGDEQDASFHGGGKTHPGACYPFGMVQLSPDTTTSGDNGTGYNYCQNTIEGFSFNHMSGIECDNDPLCYPYIESVRLNGQMLNRAYLTYEEITSGGEVKFFLKT